jgi:hypothetical protein
VYEYNEVEAKWMRVAEPVYNGVSGEEFGSSVKLTTFGTKLVVGSPGFNNRAGLVNFYHLDSKIDVWEKSLVEVKGMTALDELGKSLSVAESQLSGQQGQITVAAGATAEKSTQPGYVMSFTLNGIQ